ncbi:MAG TPA: hypothetical protein VM901_08790 [Bdellovibrionota bacterium]|jgi:hypothetical protein|nr:hypothetical protein [Bdellovibrionota bacterium]
MSSRWRKRFLGLLAVLGISAAAAYVLRPGDTLPEMEQKKHTQTQEVLSASNSEIPNLDHGDITPPAQVEAHQDHVEVAPKISREIFRDQPKLRTVASVMNLDPPTPPAPPSLLPAVPALAEDSEEEPASKPAPVARASIDESKAFARHGKIIIEPEYALATIFSKDRSTLDTATLASKYWLVVKAQYVQVWSRSFWTSLYLKLGAVDFEEPLASTKTLTNTKKILSGIGVQAQYFWNEHNRLGAHLEVAKELFVRGQNTQQDTVDAINVTSLGLKSEHDLAHLQPFLIGATIAYVAKLPAASSAYDVKFGHELGAGFYIDHLARDQKTSRFRTDLGAAYRMQSTSISTQSEMRLSLGLRLNFDLDEGGE